MKRLLILTLAISFLFGSCADLELKPQDGATANNTFGQFTNVRSYLAKIYGAYSLTGNQGPAGQADLQLVNDEGFTSYIRAYWKAQELTTDEAVIAWTDAGIQDLNTHTWSSDNQFVKVLYYRLFLIISYSNDFLEQTSASNVENFSYSDSEKETLEDYRAEVRFLRALAYWHALDLFRNIPLVTEITANPPAQSTPEAVFSFIETELNDIESLMLPPQQNEYGRADQAALWMLQAKLYLNAPVYIGEDRNTEALASLNKVLNGPYTLEPEYNNLFNADNHNSNELIFTLPSDGMRTQSYGSTTFLTHASIGGTMTATDFGVGDGWAGLRTTASLVSKFPDADGSSDGRAMFYTDGQTLEINDLLEFTNGYAVTKYSNVTSTGEDGSDVTFVDTDYPLFRLGDAYLMYAEAVLRGGSGGDAATALSFINALRERAYGDTSGNINTADLTLDFILDERARELYYEGSRRVDLIRFNKYTGNEYVWPWKGGNIDGASIDAFREIFPIPANDLVANPNLDQNDGYGG
ncbi:RagB/SusD family nutrient uptake outer membrane protein [Marivirga atlantica]|jgi:hypothetical protein|uniref:RagB/SusD family nutrient uptake outer membrane protein n=1 Tax=Marivirga atlantica TaxID=1548457 RepID=A0A937AG23_9BACT|nr:RagB/SusD family nutrient uptake outer membrane protein [Marivirga atlantica]MBL0765578.1 RagB/SusD family nutrient uptake outer membrane protein [Marivirga atlantica]